jgi:hypothetical protein
MSIKAILLTGTLVVAGVTADAGFVHVKVHEKKPDGTNLNLYVPGILATVGTHVVPGREIEKVAHKMRDVLPALAVAARELENVPDGPLVEVLSEREQVRVVKDGGSLVIDVNDRNDTVHVTVPLRLVYRVARDLQDRAAHASASPAAEFDRD